MTTALPDIDFHGIRPYGQPASRSAAFEELASILIEQGVVDWPDGARFARFGNPDGGREGKGIIPNGDVWAWQAKYLFEFDSAAAGQVTSSVRRVLSLEPTLKRYFIALPLDMPAGDTADRTSAYTRWTEKVSDWEAMARENGLEVEFAFVGAHDLITALTEPQHASRARYWFGTEVLSPEWQGRRLEEVIAKAGRRYTPRLHVEIETVQALNGVGRVDAYVARWQTVLAELRQVRQWGWRAPADVADAFAEALPTCEAALDEADAALAQFVGTARSAMELPRVEDTIEAAAQAAHRVDDLLHQHSLKDGRYFVGDAASLYSDVRRAISALYGAEQLAHSAATRAAREKTLLVVGRAGVGKTHLLCDVATRRLAEGRPTVLLLGQDFDGRSLLAQIGEMTSHSTSARQLTAFFTSAVSRFATSSSTSVTAHDVGHIRPSSRCASGLKPKDEYRSLNFDAGVKKQTTLLLSLA